MKSYSIFRTQFFTLLALSFIPFFVKGIIYLQAGSYVPITFAYLFGTPVLLGIYFKKRWAVPVVKVWSMVLMLVGVARLLLGLVLQYERIGVEAHVTDQLTYGFTLISLGYAAAGFYFWRNIRERVSYLRQV